MNKVTILAQVAKQTRFDPDGNWVCRWPALGFDTIDGLDYVAEDYTREFLLEAATTTRTDRMSLTTSELLRDLADSPAALEELNKRRRVVPAAIRALNVALHYRVAKELNRGKADSALIVSKQWTDEVHNRWRMPEATVLDIHRDYGDAAAVELERIVTRLVEKFPNQHDVLVAIDADMQSRAPMLSKSAPYKTRPKRPSRKR